MNSKVTDRKERSSHMCKSQRLGLMMSLSKHFSQMKWDDLKWLKILSMLLVILISTLANSTSVYSVHTDIEINRSDINDGVPEVFYSVQIGVYRNNIDEEIFSEFKTLIKTELPNGMIRYSTGMFRNQRLANRELDYVKNNGITDAFLIAYYRGERITLSEAERLTKEPVNRDMYELAQMMQDTISTERNNTELDLLNAQLPDSTLADSFFTVTLGLFDEPIDEERLDAYSPIIVIDLPDGRFQYSTGLFKTSLEAEELRSVLSVDGFSEAAVFRYSFEDFPSYVYEEYANLLEADSALLATDPIQDDPELVEDFEETDDMLEEVAALFVEETPDTLHADTTLFIIDQVIDEAADSLLADTVMLITAEPDSLILDTVFVTDLQLLILSKPDSIYADSISMSRFKVENDGPDALPHGARIVLEASELSIINLYCSDSSVNICEEPAYYEGESGFDVVLPDLNPNSIFEIWVEFVPIQGATIAELLVDIILPEDVTDPDLNNNRLNETFVVKQGIVPESEEVEEEELAVEELPIVAEIKEHKGFPLLITIDGKPIMIDDSRLDSDDRERLDSHSDLRSSIEIRADHRERTPILNVTAPRAAVRGQPIFFHGYTNYADWIERYELRIFERDTPSTGSPIALISPIDESGTLYRWTGNLPSDIDVVNFVLRVYDRDGNFDETLPRELPIVDIRRPDRDQDKDSRDSRLGYGVNSRSIANIQVNGGAVTIVGHELNPNSTVIIDGRSIPVDENGRFVSRQLKESGSHMISITVDDPVNGFIYQNREIIMPRREWFQLGIADFTAGMGSVSGPASLVTGQNTARYRGDEFVEGRLAFYLKGDLTQNTSITASADTREQPVSQLFTNFTERDPLALLRRLDSNYSYPIYGDEGILVDDAPTQGKFHIRLERDDSRLMWGSFRTPVSGTDLVHFNRGLYGAELHHRGLSTTSYGERKTMADVFAADPGTIGSREEFRATGGSLYYLRNQDVLLGSERVFVEVRDRESGLVLESITLQPFQDYELNALQGRIILNRPLSSVQDAQGIVRTGAVSGNPVYLVAHYEFTPSLIRLDNFTMGGRISQWFGDHLQLGLTGYSQQGMDIEQDIYGADITLRYRPGTYVRAEHANSEGRGAPVWNSIDGGFGFNQIASTADHNSNADAQRVEMGVDFSDFGNGESSGKISAYLQQRGNGFSAPGQLNTESITQGGAQARLPVGSRIAITAKGDIMEGSRSGESRAVEAGAEVFLTKRIYIQGGARNEYRETSLMGGNSQRLSETGSRTDAVGLLGYQSIGENDAKGPFNIYGILQGTIDKDESRRSNDRYGLGGGYRISDRVSISGEATNGDGGWGGKAETEISFTDRTSIYLNYLMDPDRTDQGIRGRSGNLTTGGRVRYSESTNVFVERRQEISEIGPSGLIHAFGLDFAPSVRWSYGLKLEAGNLSDSTFGDVERRAASLFAGFTSERFRWGGSVEYRSDDSSERGNRDSWLTRNTLGLQLSDGWRILGRANMAISDGGEGSVMDAEYTELVAGLAYRPSFNNRMNALFRYSYLYDLASPDQLGPRLELNPFAQKSHVFSVDGIVKVTRKISLGGKVGHRRGELRDRTMDDSEWFGSSAWLYIARGDIHIVNRWDFIAEYRWLSVEESQDVRQGYLLGLYRQIGGNLRLGIGYNFTDYSDDLTDLSFRSEGWFVNLIGLF